MFFQLPTFQLWLHHHESWWMSWRSSHAPWDPMCSSSSHQPSAIILQGAWNPVLVLLAIYTVTVRPGIPAIHHELWDPVLSHTHRAWDPVYYNKKPYSHTNCETRCSSHMPSYTMWNLLVLHCETKKCSSHRHTPPPVPPWDPGFQPSSTHCETSVPAMDHKTTF